MAGPKIIRPTSLEHGFKATPDARGKRLKSLRKMADLSRKDLEERYAINANTLRSWEEGRFTGLTKQGARRIISMLRQEGIECSIAWLLYGTGNSPKASDTLYHSQADLGREVLSFDEEKILKELECFNLIHPHSTHLVVKDNGMEPYFAEGDYVAGNKRFEQSISHLVGLNCIVETDKGEHYLRQIRQGSQQGCYQLVCVNIQTTVLEPTLYNVDLVSAAPVIWHRKRDIYPL